MGLGKMLVIAGFSILTGCASFTDNGLAINSDYDTNNDNHPDLRYIYRICRYDYDKKAFVIGKDLTAIQKDKNRNHEFEDNEYIWKKDLREDFLNLK
jgi:hypothetical protein